jgi:hypothetical protein
MATTHQLGFVNAMALNRLDTTIHPVSGAEKQVKREPSRRPYWLCFQRYKGERQYLCYV